MIVQWLLDTRPLWPIHRTGRGPDQVKQLEIVASRALALLPASEQASVLKFYQLKDAKASLGSYLLKHLVIANQTGRPDQVPFDFNVSHQAGIVTLIASIGIESKVDVGTDIIPHNGSLLVDVGTDVVCVNERLAQDYANIEKDGLFSWIDMHGDVFAKSELDQMKLGLVPVDLGSPLARLDVHGEHVISSCQSRNQMLRVGIVEEDEMRPRNIIVDSNSVIDAKLRRFYTMWCLREAYVKMTGEALLAPWLKQLEILDVHAPAAATSVDGPDSLNEGEISKEFKIIMKGNLVTNVRMHLTALGTDYIVGGALTVPNGCDESVLSMGKWNFLDLEKDILTYAESHH